MCDRARARELAVRLVASPGLITMALGDDTLTFRAKTLAQAHPLTATASDLIERVVHAQAASLPMEEMGQWIATAMLIGYCVRAVEEDATSCPRLTPTVSVDLGAVDAAADDLVARIRSASGKGVVVGDPDEVIAALDAVITGEVAKRVDPWRDQVGADAWASFEEFVAYYVVKGYAIRAAETAEASAS